jgi:hypothetical protein
VTEVGGTARPGPTAPGTTGSHGPGEREVSPQRRATWLALVVAIVGLLQAGTPPRVSVLSLIVLVATLALSLRWRMERPAIIVLLAVGLALRLAPPTGFSDVLVVSEAAIREMLAGGNPYGHGFAESVPPGAPFAYGPLALLWYLPSLDRPGSLELLSSIVVLGVLALRGRSLGLAIFAVTPALVVAATDGSNDSSAGLLILVALLAALRWPVAGALLLAVATAFKPYALAWLPGLIAYAGSMAPLVAFLVATMAAWLPALLAWGPEALLWSFRRSDEIHAQPYYSLAYGLGSPESVPKAAWQAVRVGVGVMLAAASLVLVRSAASFILMGALVFSATLFLGFWGTFAYLAAVAPILCWHLDDWLGLGPHRVTWPGDPVGRLSRAVDTRWPVRRPDRHRMESPRGLEGWRSTG